MLYTSISAINQVIDYQNIAIDSVITVAIAVSYYLAIWNKFSPIYRLTELFFTNWDKDAIPEIRKTIQTLTSVSATLAGVSLATVAFITVTTGQTQKVENIIGVVIMLSSSVLFFWSLGSHFAASLPVSKDKQGENEKLFKLGYFLISFGVYLFFMGPLWALSGINPLYSYISAIAYFVVFAGLVISFRNTPGDVPNV